MWWLLLSVALGGDLLAERHTRFGEVRVVEEGSVRILEIDGQPQTALDRAQPGRHVYRYTATMAAQLPDTPGTALVIGLGGGTLPRLLDGEGWTVDAVEVNPAIARFARHYFDLPHTVDVHVADGVRFVARTEAHWDVVLVDVVSQAGLPEALTTPAFYEDLLRIADRIVVNSWVGAPHARDELRNWRAAGHLVVVPVEGAGNRVLVIEP